MNRYQFFQKEEENWCIPACLQSILCRRGFEIPSQEEIFSSFERNNEGIVLNEKSLNLFLKYYKLKSEYIHPRTSFIETDYILDESLKQKKDVLVAFYYNQAKEIRHVSLLTDLEFPEVVLHDPDRKINRITLANFVSAMPIDQQCGFYVIN